MKKIFLDTGIFELYFMGNQSIKEIFNQIKNETIKVFTLELNLFEYFYKTCEKIGKETALIRNISIRKSKIKILDINMSLTEKSGFFRCKYSQLSTVDAYICGCADANNLLIYTTDSDFKDIKEIKTKFFPLK